MEYLAYILVDIVLRWNDSANVSSHAPLLVALPRDLHPIDAEADGTQARLLRGSWVSKVDTLFRERSGCYRHWLFDIGVLGITPEWLWYGHGSLRRRFGRQGKEVRS
jgi:hypothetical protein